MRDVFITMIENRYFLPLRPEKENIDSSGLFYRYLIERLM